MSVPSPNNCTSAHYKGGRANRGAVFSGGAWSQTAQQLEVYGKINGVTQQVLLDTGASMSLTAPKFFEKHNPELAEYIERTMRPTKQRLVGCNGKFSTCRGIVSLRVRVGNHEWTESEVYVLDACPHPFIVCWPSLVREDFKLFARTGRCQFGSGPTFNFINRVTDVTFSAPTAYVEAGQQAPEVIDLTKDVVSKTDVGVVDLTKGALLRTANVDGLRSRKRRDTSVDAATNTQPVRKMKKTVRWQQPLDTEATWTLPQDRARMLQQAGKKGAKEVTTQDLPSVDMDNAFKDLMAVAGQRLSRRERKIVKRLRMRIELMEKESGVLTGLDWDALFNPHVGKVPRVTPFKEKNISGWARIRRPGDQEFKCSADYEAAYAKQEEQRTEVKSSARPSGGSKVPITGGSSGGHHPRREMQDTVKPLDESCRVTEFRPRGTARAVGRGVPRATKTIAAVVPAPTEPKFVTASAMSLVTGAEVLETKSDGEDCPGLVGSDSEDDSDSDNEGNCEVTFEKDQAAQVRHAKIIAEKLEEEHKTACEKKEEQADKAEAQVDGDHYSNAQLQSGNAPTSSMTLGSAQVKDDGQDSNHPTQVAATVDKKKARRWRKLKSTGQVETQLKSGSQPGTSVSHSSARATTRNSRLPSMPRQYPRVCPVSKAPLPSSGPVNVAQGFVIPAMSEASVPVTLVHDHTNDKSAQYLFEPTPIPQMKGKMWRAAACCTQRRKSGEVLVRIMNPTCMEVTLHPGATLGTWEHLSVKQVMGITKLDDPADAKGEEGARGSVKRMASARAEKEGESRESADDEKEVTHATDEELRTKVEEGGDHLTNDEKRRLFYLLRRFKFMFRKKPGRTDVVQHEIDTGTSKPIRGGRYRQSEKERTIIRDIVKDMEKMGVVRPSKSPWGASVVLVPKKDGTTRFCVDYRRLNEITAKDVYPLPRIDATLDQLGGCKFFTAMDLTSGYWQVDMKDEDAAKTAFITPDGLFEFTAMPFGLCNAPATFQRLMDNVLGNLRYEYALVYLDDVMVHSKTFDEHLVHLESVLSCLQKASLACKLKKCSFAQESTTYLGHVVSGKGIEPEPAKIDAVKEIAPPKNVKEIRMFLGFVGYYRRFVNNFSAVAKPLNELLRKTVEWHWGPEQQDAFEALRNFTKTFTVRTDASYLGLGACILQGEGDERLPIAYASRSLKPAETRYTATEIECLGMKWAVGVFRPYIHGRKFTLETDHIALKWLRTVQHTNGRLIRTAMELQQYDMDIVHRAGIKMYDADALSRLRRTREDDTGKETAALIATVTDHAVYFGEGDPTPRDDSHDEPSGPCPVTVDLLRAERDKAKAVDKKLEWEETRRGPANAVYVAMGQEELEESNGHKELMTKLQEELEKDVYYSKLYRQLSKEDLPPEELTVRLRNDLSKFVVREGHLYRIEQLYRGGRAQAGRVRYLLWIPEKLRTDVLFACHDHMLSGGHLGVQKTFARLRIRYYWTGMFKAVEDWCKSCESCSSRKDPAGMQSPLTPLPVPSEPFQFISVDVLGPFVAAEGSGNRYVLVYCDHLTRWVETVAFRRNDSAVMARVLVERIMCRHGAPQTILTDRGRPFMSALAREVYRLLRVKKVSTAAYRPQTNGLVERFNRTLASMLSMYVNSKHNDWDKYLPYVTFAYNTTAHSITKETPFFLLYGREARLPIDTMLLPTTAHPDKSVGEYRAELVEGLKLAHEFSREALLRSKQQQEMARGSGSRVREYAVDELVMVKNPALNATPGLTRKLTNAWVGPFKIMRKMGPTTYRVTGVSGRGRAVSVNRLKKYYDYEHPEADEDDYANYLSTAGEPVAGEGNRTYAPTDAEARMPAGDGENEVPTGVNVDMTGEEPDEPAETSEGSAVIPATAEASAPVARKGRGRPKSPAPKASTIVRRPEPGPELGLITPVPPGGGLRTICNRCHEPKRNHKCKGRYIPVRQLTVARRRLGLADVGARPIFGIVDDSGSRLAVFGVYAPNDVRVMKVLDGRLSSWEAEAKKAGREDDDIWNNECFKCEEKGRLYTCYGCNLAYHPRCSVAPTLARRLRFEENFLCPDCLRDCVEPNAPLVPQGEAEEADTNGEGDGDGDNNSE